MAASVSAANRDRAGDQIVLTRGTPAQVAVIDIRTGRVSLLTKDKKWHSDPVWAPNGKEIAFVAWPVGGSPSVEAEIYRIDAAGRGLRALTNNALQDSAPAWSPDGRHIAFLQQGPPGGSLGRVPIGNIMLIASTGGNARQVTFDRTGKSALVWSPDGREIAFAGRTDQSPNIYVVDVGNGDVHQLTFTPSGGGDGPAWSPDGRSIAFVQSKGTGQAIAVMNPDGSNMHQIVPARSNQVIRDLAWSPDGRVIAFSGSRKTAAGAHIALADARGNGVRLLTAARWHIDEQPVWAPNGGRILFGRYFLNARPRRARLALIDRRGKHLRVLDRTSINWGFDSWKWRPQLVR
jgi:TolB protein